MDSSLLCLRVCAESSGSFFPRSYLYHVGDDHLTVSCLQFQSGCCKSCGRRLMEAPGTRHEMNGRPENGFEMSKYPQKSAVTTGFAMRLTRPDEATENGRLCARETEMESFCGKLPRRRRNEKFAAGQIEALSNREGLNSH